MFKLKSNETLLYVLAYLKLSSSVLLHFDPQERAQIVQQAHTPGAASLQELERNIDSDQIPAVDLCRRRRRYAVHWNVIVILVCYTYISYLQKYRGC